jgi:hypothetical protein
MFWLFHQMWEKILYIRACFCYRHLVIQLLLHSFNEARSFVTVFHYYSGPLWLWFSLASVPKPHTERTFSFPKSLWLGLEGSRAQRHLSLPATAAVLNSPLWPQFPLSYTDISQIPSIFHSCNWLCAMGKLLNHFGFVYSSVLRE